MCEQCWTLSAAHSIVYSNILVFGAWNQFRAICLTKTPCLIKIEGVEKQSSFSVFEIFCSIMVRLEFALKWNHRWLFLGRNKDRNPKSEYAQHPVHLLLLIRPSRELKFNAMNINMPAVFWPCLFSQKFHLCPEKSLLEKVSAELKAPASLKGNF